MEILGYGRTDVGCIRHHNEDNYLVRDDLLIYVVADGVGGAAAGEIASQLFVDTCEKEFSTDSGWSKDPHLLIKRCFHHAHKAIHDYAERYPETRGMACTAELLTFSDDHYYLGHVGDSRTYLIRNGTITQLSKDHSYVQEQLDLGLINPVEAEQHWLRNAIFRAVGNEEELQVDLLKGRVKPGDVFLLCSDGLSDLVKPDELLQIIDNDAPLEELTQQLIERAKHYGGKDNITAILSVTKGPVASRGLASWLLPK